MTNLATKPNTQTLVVGEGSGTRPDAVTVDKNPGLQPNVIHDLNELPWPFEDDQFKNIVCQHVLEHLQNFDGVMSELNRICRPDGVIWIQVPHFSSRLAHSPGHFFSFNISSFDAYLGGPHWVGTAKRFKLLKRKITFHKAFRRYQLHRLFNRFPIAYERFWTYLFPAEHLEFELQPIKK